MSANAIAGDEPGTGVSHCGALHRVEWEWEATHSGPISASDCGRETLLDWGVEGLAVLPLGSLLAMFGKKPAMEERRDEGRDADPWLMGDSSVEPCLS